MITKATEGPPSVWVTLYNEEHMESEAEGIPEPSFSTGVLFIHPFRIEGAILTLLPSH